MVDTSLLRRTLTWVVVGSLSACALIAAVAVVIGDFGRGMAQATFVSLSLTGFTFTTVSSTVGADRPWNTGFTIAGATASALGMMASLVVILQGENVTWAMVRVLLVLIVASTTIPACALLLLAHGRGAVVNGVVLAAVGLVTTFAALLLIVILFRDGEDGPEAFYRLMAVVGIFAVLGAVVVPILSRITPRR